MQTKTLFTQKDYTPWKDTNLEGKILIRDVSQYHEEFRDAKYQLILATGGFGCDPNKLGNAIFVIECQNDKPEHYRMERCENQILGIATEEAIAEWKEKYGEFNDEVMQYLNKEGK